MLLTSAIVVLLILSVFFVLDRRRSDDAKEANVDGGHMCYIDKLLLIGIATVGALGGAIDGFMWLPVENLSGGFPVFSGISIFLSYMMWVGMMIWSIIKKETISVKPKLVRWYTYFLIPFLHIPATLIGWFIAFVLVAIFC